MNKNRDKEAIKLFGLKVREIRSAKGLTQDDLAFESGLVFSQIGRIERGEINTSINTVFIIARTLKVDVKELFDFALPPFENQQEQ